MATPKFEPANNRDENPDPITGAPGSHPIETGVGTAAGGLAAGALLGAAGGPAGAAAGAVVGGLVGGLAGKEIGEQIDPTSEDAYWREHYRHRSYVEPGTDYEAYRPAYRYGWESRSRYTGRRFDEVEPELAKGWSGKSNLTWDKAKLATKDAWDRIERALPGDADGDGR
jgi:hypothetical protein